VILPQHEAAMMRRSIMSWQWRPVTVVVLMLSLGLSAACSPGAQRPEVPAESAVPTATTGAAETGRDSVFGYKLGPGDAVRLTVFRHEDLSGEFELDGEGFFSMPLVGEILAGGLTARQLENEIEIRLKNGGYLVDPQASIEVLNYRPFYVIGEVRNPGSYEYVNGMTLINAIALAGGFTYRGDQDDIVISRGGSHGEQLQGEPDSAVLPGDIVEVKERFF
jgi:protein involved in polysaccharide export with SLBB domain